MTPTATFALATYQDEAEVVETRSQAVTIADRARGLQVVDEATNTEALTLLAECRKTGKRIEDLRKSFVAPLNEHVKNINAYFASNAAPVKEADGILAQKTSAYRFKVAEMARKEQERLRVLAEKRYEAQAAKAEAKGLDAPPVIPLAPTVAAPAKTVATDAGSVTFIERRSFEITDAAAVPRELCCPDEKKIGQMVRAKAWEPANAPAGIRIIITQEPSVR